MDTPRDPVTRGTADERAALARDDELAIDAVLLTRFFRPYGPQARWVDPRPLGDVRDSTADARAEPDDAWADAIVTAAGIARVCVLDPDADAACRGRDGGVLRFSHPYLGPDGAARVFVAWTPVGRGREDRRFPEAGGPAFEMHFRMERSGRAWRIAEHRTVNR